MTTSTAASTPDGTSGAAAPPRPRRGPRGLQPAVAARWAAAGLVVLGVALRAVQYASGRALWLDEAFLWLDLDNLSPDQLTDPLPLAQGAPIAFLLSVKAIMGTLGDAEWALRLLPFLAGVGALLVSWRVAVRVLPAGLVWLAVAPVALGQSAIWYSTELKQYSLDMLVAAVLLLVLLWAARAPIGARAAAVLGVVGAGALWLSNPAAFVLAGGGAALIGEAALRGRWRRATLLAAAGAVWLASFVLVYLTHIRDLGAVRTLATVDTGGDSPDAVLTSVRRLVVALAAPLGGATLVPLLVQALVLLGLVVLWRTGKGVESAVLGLPVAATGAAVLAGQYPAYDRFVLFLAPALAAAAAAGVGAAWTVVRRGGALLATIAVLAAIAALLPQARNLGGLPFEREEMDTLTARLAREMRPGDTIYLYYPAQYAFAYYAPRAGIPVTAIWGAPVDSGVLPGDAWAEYAPVLASGSGIVVGRASSDAAARIRDVDRVRGAGRVWLVFSHARRTKDGADETELMLARARTLARERDVIRVRGASAILMEAP